VRKKLGKHEVLWILNTTHSKQEEFYKEHYLDYEGFNLTNGILGQVTKNILFDCGEMGRAMEMLQYNMTMYEVLENKRTFTLNEMFWFAFKNWAFYLERKDFDRLCEEGWEEWADDFLNQIDEEYKQKEKNDGII
jgi:hypothetical protein